MLLGYYTTTDNIYRASWRILEPEYKSGYKGLSYDRYIETTYVLE